MLTYQLLITGADRGLGFGMTKALLEKGHTVFAGQYLKEWKELSQLKTIYPNTLFLIPLDISDENSIKQAYQDVCKFTNKLDIIINNAGIVLKKDNRSKIGESIDYDELLKLYNVNTLGAFRVVNQFLPLIEKGQTKKLCFVSSEASSIERSRRTEMYGYCMSKTALNMMVKIMFNDLRPKDYRFRLYHPGWIKSYMSGSLFEGADLSIDEAASFALKHFLSDIENEDELSLIDYKGNRWPY